jgi:hypothetical protein
MKKKKQIQNPIEHEQNYIEFLKGQLAWQIRQEEKNIKVIEELKYKLSKARLKLKVLNMGH